MKAGRGSGDRGAFSQAGAGWPARAALLVGAVLSLLVCASLLVYGAGRGLDLTDEIFYLIWANLENSFLIPRIMKSSVDLPGLAIIVALLVGSAVAGVVGAAVSVPTAVLVAVLLDEYLVRKD